MSRKSKQAFPKSSINAFHEDGDVKIVKATVEHAGYLQHHLRDTDIRECMIHGATPWRALHVPLSSKHARTWTGLYKDEPVCMFGVFPFENKQDLTSGHIWMLGSSVLDDIPRKFLRTSKLMSNWLCDQYDWVENLVPIEHERTIKWLDWLGYSFSNQPTVINGYHCLRFVRCQRDIEVRFE